MKLMPIKQAQAKLFNAMSDKTLKAITLYTFKKDRSISLQRTEANSSDADRENETTDKATRKATRKANDNHSSENTWILTEQGFESDRLILTTGSKDKRLIKEAFKREFPRSTRAYVAEIH